MPLIFCFLLHLIKFIHTVMQKAISEENFYILVRIYVEIFVKIMHNLNGDIFVKRCRLCYVVNTKTF